MSCLLTRESPMIIALNKEKTVYDGFITVTLLEKDFRIRISLPPDQQMKRAKLHYCWQMKRLLYGYQHIVKQRLQHSANLMAFLLELKTVLEVALKSQPGCQFFSPPQYYSQLITEIEILGWDKMLFIDAEFCTLKLKAEDSAGHQHAITVKLKSKVKPRVKPYFISYFLSISFVPLVIMWATESTLANVHSQFLLNVEALSEFWSMLDEIDKQTWVLEPEKPTKADSMRRIAIGNNVSIKVQIDPRHPKMLPECCLLGAEHVVTPLRNKLNANMHLWNPDCSVLQNMKDVLEIEFPSPTTHEKSVRCIFSSHTLPLTISSTAPSHLKLAGIFFIFSLFSCCFYHWERCVRISFNWVASFYECSICILYLYFNT
uniref:FA complementation group L n=1 Tax=Cyprinus carpio TaxID=7962 RepID=A0A8C1ZQ28_CYPCA